MGDIQTRRLRECVARYQSLIPALSTIGASLGNVSLEALVDLYEDCYPLLEEAMWGNASAFDEMLACYQSLFREQDALIQQLGDDRHHFILSIPVADRPAHLQTCLESIYQLCCVYGYGGISAGVYPRIKVIVAEDSRDDGHVQRHIALVEEYQRKGLQVFHFGQAEQFELLQSLPKSTRNLLGNILTTLPRERFYLKGQAANRNLSYLKCLQLAEDKQKTLFYMVDSDQSFCINRMTEEGEQAVYALNYFHSIDKLFRTTDTLMLTGKLVGDPPVSPSVMAANFLDDVTAFFSSLSEVAPEEACRFHLMPSHMPGDAAYHDMAGLFGFENVDESFPYRCRLAGEHDHIDCLQDFSHRLNGFFFGEHLTRKTYYHHQNDSRQLSPARTVYPGNYVVNYEGLKYIIPFGHLRLRMSGPTAGRLIAAEIGERFASVNLPHLHRRISNEGLSGDFRPGVELGQANERQAIDLSNEFERQFFGDLMLFTTEALVKAADVKRPFSEEVVSDVIASKEQELLELYRQKHHAIGLRKAQLQALVFSRGHWWLSEPKLGAAMQRVRAFLDNIEFNFGEKSQAWQAIQSVEHRGQRKRQIVEALVNYRSERNAWDQLFA